MEATRMVNHHEQIGVWRDKKTKRTIQAVMIIRMTEDESVKLTVAKF